MGKISYGPHVFPGEPKDYVRVDNPEASSEGAHEKIKQSLVAVFNSEDDWSLLSQLARRFDFDSNSPVNISFMNHGNTQLVYLASIGKRKFALLINQPHTRLGIGRREFEGLESLFQIDSRFVVEPYAYFNFGEKGHEVYATQYVDNAICVAGPVFYDPLPFYHSEMIPFGIDSEVNSSMIALFVNYYDTKRRRGLAKTQTCGNDFILTRDFDKKDPRSVQPNMKIIAARGFVSVPLEEYLNLLRQEFLIATNRDEKEILSGKIKVNHCSRKAMSPEDIERGIQRGLEMRKQRI